MASKQDDAGQSLAPVLAAVASMQGNASRSEKTQAHEFLEKFQKSVRQTFYNYQMFVVFRQIRS